MGDAFVSAVQDRNDPSRLVVRARNKNHLERLFPGHEIVITPKADCAARVFVSRDEFIATVARRIGEIDYDDFKASVGDRRLHDLYSEFWNLHRRYQKETGTLDRSRHFSWDDGDVQFLD